MELGLLYYNARFYAPTLDRFISADTLIPNPANPQSYNRYAYVGNRPLNFSDPTGHCKGANLASQCLVDGDGGFLPSVTAIALAGGMSATAIQYFAQNPEAMWAVHDSLVQAREAVDDVLAQAEEVINSTPDLDLQPERQREYRTISDLPDNDGNARILYHYTSAEGLAGILESQKLNPSLGENGDAHWGDGQYFTDISPSNAQTGTAGQLSRALYNVGYNQRKVQYYIAVDVSDIAVTAVAPVYSRTYGEKFIYLHSSQTPLDLTDKIVNYGPTPLKK
jgi:RHS repeat-associated protein